MCGIFGIISKGCVREYTDLSVINHRGPDNSGKWENDNKSVSLYNCRLAIIDPNDDGNQPIVSSDGNYVIVFNGELYNYSELRNELKSEYKFKTNSDTEVVAAAYKVWGERCLNRFIGMFSFTIWNIKANELFAAVDRFGVKPFYYNLSPDGFVFGSEIKALHDFGIAKEMDENTWASYLGLGLYDHSESTFWKNIKKLTGGHYLKYNTVNGLVISKWYDPLDIINDVDSRDESVVEDELLSLMEDSVRYRFVSDVPVGVCLSGGLDSSLLVALIRRVKGNDFPLQSFTFYTNDEKYDEVKYVKELAKIYKFTDNYCLLETDEVPKYADRLSYYMDEPFGGIPSVAMSKVYESAHNMGLKVLLDGNGLDEGWAGYDYYNNIDEKNGSSLTIQGSKNLILLKDYMGEDFRRKIENTTLMRSEIQDSLARLQYRDIKYSKIPRAMRFADRNSMSYSVEVREPYLDHRIIELGLRQQPCRKIKDGSGKYLVRNLGLKILNASLSELPKRPVQTPQREWLKESLNGWAINMAKHGLDNCPKDWFKLSKIHELIEGYKKSGHDNSFYLWQLVNLGLLIKASRP